MKRDNQKEEDYDAVTSTKIAFPIQAFSLSMFLNLKPQFLKVYLPSSCENSCMHAHVNLNLDKGAGLWGA